MMCGTVQAAPVEETQELESTAVVSEEGDAVAEEAMPETEDTQEEDTAQATEEQSDVQRAAISDREDVSSGEENAADQSGMDDGLVPADDEEKSATAEKYLQIDEDTDEAAVDIEIQDQETEQDSSFVNAYHDLTIQVERGEGISAYRNENLPSSYSSVDRGYVTSVKNQGYYGICWAFAWLAAAESNLLRSGTKSYDLSELQLAYGTYHTPSISRKGLEGDSLTISGDYLKSGGNNLLTTFISAAWIGAVDEDTDSAVSWDQVYDSYVMPEEYYYNHNAVVLSDAYWMMMKDTATVKKAIMDYGAVASGMYYDNSYRNYKDGTWSYYYNTDTKTNHAVTIVGWDDSFGKDNFKTAAPGDGAWLVKNSYGTGTDNEGYVWVSYYDQSMSATNAFVVRMEADHEDHIYQYDGSAYPFRNCNSNYAANVFTANGKEILKSVSFAANYENIDYYIEIYRGVKDVPTSGMKVYEQSGHEDYAGYHKITLDQDIPLTAGEKFAIVVHLESGSSVAYVLADRTANGGWFQCVSHSEEGQSYTSSDKKNWTDQSASGSYNCRIKAFTDTQAGESVDIPMTSMTLDKEELSLSAGETYQLKVQYAPTNTTDSLTVSWESSNVNVVSVDANGTAKACGSGTAVITCMGSRFTAKCTVTVKKVTLNDDNVYVYPYYYYYTGADITPDPIVYYGNTRLTRGTDYTVAYRDNRLPGWATVTVTGAGAFEGTGSCRFGILPAVLKESMVSLSQTSYTYDGKAKTPAVNVSGLKEEIDYYVRYYNNVNVGTASVKVVGINNYSGEVTKEFTIAAAQNSSSGNQSSGGSSTGGSTSGENTSGSNSSGSNGSGGSGLYDDVAESSGWRYDAIKYVKDNGIMNGISGTRNFAPDDPLTRAMFATIIYRMEGSPSATYASKFPDVPNGNYYSLPVLWANAAGIINGHSNTGLFGSAENITREDMVVIMYRYCKYKGIDTSSAADLGRFPDASSVSAYAKDAVRWAVANGIINGRSNTGMLDPKGNASRVETAAIIQRFMNKTR